MVGCFSGEGQMNYCKVAQVTIQFMLSKEGITGK